MSKVKCAICRGDLENEYGNNPYPIVKSEEAKCCNTCNEFFVIPARVNGVRTLEEKIGSNNVLLTIDKIKEMFVENKLESGLYSSTDEDGCDVIVIVQEDVGFDIHTNQKNGWVRIDSFDYDSEDKTWTRGESYGGKWK